ncbi:MAG: hypothetical protein KIT33_11745 [Candidatus Kapabacteria bacterium]|nr:hypothetical protein [Ignavibacteriota bacterium]MCW5885633.1 hypothetical protein [Candidatus Kapabacteria bacterium]
MKKLTVLFFFLIISYKSYSQKETYNWNFGYHAALSFKTADLEPIFVSGSQLSSWEGCATISDSDGNLLFYASGNNIWNKNNVVMENGSNLLGHSSATQSCVAFKSPSNPSQYYIFTVDAVESNRNGFNYSVVDITRNNGLGSVIQKNIKIHPKPIERLAVIPHANRRGYWVIVHLWESNEYLAYLVDANGVSSQPVVSQGTFRAKRPTGSVLKPSLDGTKIASAHSFAEVIELFDFNDFTGKMTLTHNLTHEYFKWPYGVEFSPDMKLLYASLMLNPCRLVQLDLTKQSESAIVSSMTILESRPVTFFHGSLQLGPNGKIYVARDGTNFLGVINNPNNLGLSCNYDGNGFKMPVSSGLGLPTFVQNFVLPSNVCPAKGNEVVNNWNFDEKEIDIDSDLNKVSESNLVDFLTPGSYIIYDKNPINVDDDCSHFNQSNNLIFFHTRIGNNILYKFKTNVKSGEEYALTFKFLSMYLKSYTNLEIFVNGKNIAEDFLIAELPCTMKTLEYPWISQIDGEAEIIFNYSSNDTDIFAIDEISFKPCSCPEIVFNEKKHEICFGGSIELEGLEDARFSHKWSPVLNIDNPNSSNPIVNPKVTTKYSVEITDMANGCQYSDSITVIVSPEKELKIFGSDFICIGDSIIIGVDSDEFVELEWSTGQKESNISISSPGLYEVIAIDENGCVYKGSKEVFVTERPEFSISGPLAVCFEEEFEISINQNFTNILWSDGQTTQKAKFKGPGTYSVKISVGESCFNEDSIKVTLKPDQEIEIAGESVICFGDNTILSIEGDFIKIEWNTGDTGNNITANKSGTYTVTAIDNNGCKFSGNKTLELFDPLNLSIESIDLGSFCISERVSINRVITPNNNQDVEVLNVYNKNSFDGLNISVYDELPYIIENGKLLSLKIDFIAKGKIGPFSDTLIIELGKPCPSVYKIPITGTIKDANSSIWLADTVVEAGTYICLPIYAKIDCDGYISGDIDYYIEIDLNKKVFLPEKAAHGNFRFEDLGNGFIRIYLDDIAYLKAGVNIINYICGRVLLSDSLNNIIDITHFNWDSDIPINISNGSIGINQCQFGIRHLDIIKRTGIRSIPNVANDDFTIEAVSSEIGVHQIELVDITGNLIQTLNFNRINKTDNDIFHFPISTANMKSGVVFLIYRTPWSSISEKVIIIK